MLFMIQKVRRTGMNSCRPFRPQLFLWVDSNLLSPFHAQDAGATPNIYNSSIGKPIKLGLDRERDALLQVPKSAINSPLPLLLFLHGATQSADDMFWYLDSAPEEAGVVILAPNSRDTTWDAITDSFGPDVEFLKRALERVFETVVIDAARIAVGGFSDGATYAIEIGLI